MATAKTVAELNVPRSLQRNMGCTKIEVPLDPGYTADKVLGAGAYGVVVRAEKDGRKVAVKRIKEVFANPITAKRTLREVKIMSLLGRHPNILQLLDIFAVSEEEKLTFNEVSLVTNLMETDLDFMIKRCAEQISDVHVQSFAYQILCGLNYLHSANCLHRDLKPANCFVNGSDCRLRIGDFGLSRPEDSSVMTQVVVTLWWRAPEVICGAHYSKPVDLWSAGCIIAELMLKKTLLAAKDQVAQLAKIMEVTGSPTEDEIADIPLVEAQTYVRSQPQYPRPDFATVLPEGTSPEAVELVEKLLVWNPEKRLSAAEALAKPFFNDVREEEDEATASELFISFDFDEEALGIPETRNLIYNEMLAFHPELGKHDPEMLK